MVEREAVVAPKAGLHGRPAARFVQKAKGYDSEIVVIKDGKQVNAKSPMKLMTLGAKHGAKLIIRAEGDDEAEAVEALVALLSEGEE